MRTLLSFLILLNVQFCLGSFYQSETKTADQKLTSYTVQPKDTWTNLSKKYSTTIKELQSANPGIIDLKIGQTIKVPTVDNTKVRTGTTAVKSSEANASPIKNSEKNAIYYTVKPQETLYRISKNNNVSVDDLKKWNGLTTNNVTVNQRLIVGYGGETKAEKEVEKNEVPAKQTSLTENQTPKSVEVTEIKTPEVKKEKEAGNDSSVTSKEVTTNTTSANKIIENGVVSWLGDGDLNQNKFYALHRTVPIGTIIKVTNRMNNNSVFVKVVGALPTTGDNENIILKITQAAAQRIGALDQKFQAELSYAIGQ